jgi:hypothetical protein
MFEHPYFLGLFILALAFLVWRSSRYYLRHAYLETLRQAGGKNWFNFRKIQTFCSFLGWTLLVIAAANLMWGFTERQTKQPVHKYVLINDGSGSMVDGQAERGMGQRLTVLNKGNKALLNMLDKRSDGSRDMVGAVVFSTDAFVISYMVDDPKFVGKKLDLIEYRQPPLSQGTDVDKAIWSGLEMLIANTEEPGDDLYALQSRMYGQGHRYAADEISKAAVEKYKPKTEHSCLIVFTDGEFAMPEGHHHRMSVFKLLHLCKDLGVRVYVVSVETVDPFVLRYVTDTGGYAQVFKDFDEQKFEKAYESIVQSQTKDEIVVEQRVNRSLAPYFGLAALSCLFIGSLLRLTTDRNFTEV